MTRFPCFWKLLAAAGVPFVVIAQGAASPRVVSYSADAKAPARWTVGARPLLEIGGADGMGPTEFTKVVAVTRQRDGTLVVANTATRELRFFDARGQFLRSATRSGKGPGEIGEMDRMFVADDTIVVNDNRLKLHVYAPNGKWIRSLVVPPVPGYIVNPAVGALSAFDVVIRVRGGESERTGRTGTIRDDSIWFARMSLRDTSVRVVLGQRNAPLFGRGPGAPRIYPFGFAPRTLIAVTRGRICTGYPETYDVLCTDSVGRPLFRIVRAMRPRAITDSARRAYRAQFAGRRPDGTSTFEGSLRAHRERVAAATQFVSHYPAYSQLLFARTGELWVRAFATADGWQYDPLPSSAAPSNWSIYDAQGTWIADCTLPPHYAPAEIGADYVVGISRDADDVERVTLLSLKR